MVVFRWVAIALVASTVAAVLAFVALVNSRVDLSEFDGRYAAAADTAPTVQFFGTSSMLFSDGDTNIMIDGWFSRFSTATVLFGKLAPDIDAVETGLAKLGNPDVAALIPVHTHLDHAMDISEVAKRTGAVLLGSASAANIARGGGLPEDQIRIVGDGTTVRLGDFSVTLIRTKHFLPANSLFRESDSVIDEPVRPPASGWDYRQGDVYSVLIEHPSGSALVHASPGIVDGAFDELDVDTVYLGVGFLGSQTLAYQDDLWREVITSTRPDGLYFIHWDGFTVPPHSIEPGGKPVAPNRLWDMAFGMQAKTGLELAFSRAAADGIPAALLPMWSPVDAFHVATP